VEVPAGIAAQVDPPAETTATAAPALTAAVVQEVVAALLPLQPWPMEILTFRIITAVITTIATNDILKCPRQLMLLPLRQWQQWRTIKAIATIILDILLVIP